MSKWTPKSNWALNLWCILAAFGAYACMYGFRKPFTSAHFDHGVYGDQLKIWLVTAQTLGYACSKFIGVKVISEMRPERRAVFLIFLIGIAELALVLFALTPAPYNAIWLFCNGLPLGMVFGLVLGFMEGRKMTDFFVSGLCASFILADGFTKTVGKWLLERGVNEFWMPATAGGLFLVPLVIFVFMLQQIPPPSAEDVEERSERTPMTKQERRGMIKRHGLVLSGVFLTYMLITVVRSMRADFGVEVWKSLGYDGKPEVFAISEFWVGLVATGIAGLLVLVKCNRNAFVGGLGLCLLGLVAALGAFWAFDAQLLSGFHFMVILGIGMYVPYVAIHTSIFERFVAMTRERANMGFLMYIADSLGYLGFIILLIFKDKITNSGSFWTFFNTTSQALLLVSLVGIAFTISVTLMKRHKQVEKVIL